MWWSLLIGCKSYVAWHGEMNFGEMNAFNPQVILICILSLIPWPGPSVFKISCSRESARVVRKIVQSRWLPILEKYQVKIPLECPFHPLRDIFGPQQAAKKQNRPSQWTCSFCGKSFYEEKHLDLHFDARHNTIINTGEDAICLAKYCDIMRCKVLVAKDSTLSFGDSIISTDIEIWSEATAYRTALSTSGPRDLAKLPNRDFLPSLLRLQSNKLLVDELNDDGSAATDDSDLCNENCDKLESEDIDDDGTSDAITEQSEANANNEDDDGEESDSNATTSCDGNLVDSSLPPADKKQQRLTEFQRMKANCKSEELEKLKTTCEVLVRDCIAGLLVHLSNEDFKAMEEELNRAVCWYLTCDRYWEDGPIDQRSFPWALVFVLVVVLSFGVSFCYYIIWILFDSDDHNMPPEASFSTNSLNYMQTGHMSPTHHVHPHCHHLQQHQQQQQHHQHQHLSSTSGGNLNYQTPLLHSHQSPSMPAGTLASTSSNHPINAQSNIPVSVTVNPMPSSQSTTPANGYPEEYYTAHDFNDLGQSEHYIYVTYPPELKRRLLESCYNRTTRL